MYFPFNLYFSCWLGIAAKNTRGVLSGHFSFVGALLGVTFNSYLHHVRPLGPNCQELSALPGDVTKPVATPARASNGQSSKQVQSELNQILSTDTF